MTTLLENPMPLIFFGIIAEAVLGVILLRTGRGAILWAMLGVLLLVMGGLGLERLVVTEAEEVEATLEAVADALLANDVDRVFQYVAPEAGMSRARARQALGMYRLTSVKMNNLKITINRLTSPPTAKARFIGVFTGKDQTGMLLPSNGRYGFEVKFRQEGDRWLITGHSEGDPRKFM